MLHIESQPCTRLLHCYIPRAMMFLVSLFRCFVPAKHLEGWCGCMLGEVKRGEGGGDEFLLSLCLILSHPKEHETIYALKNCPRHQTDAPFVVCYLHSLHSIHPVYPPPADIVMMAELLFSIIAVSVVASPPLCIALRADFSIS